VDNNYLDLGMNKSGFVHTLPSGRLNWPLLLLFMADCEYYLGVIICIYRKRNRMISSMFCRLQLR
jgi:hypothetical protein